MPYMAKFEHFFCNKIVLHFQFVIVYLKLNNYLFSASVFLADQYFETDNVISLFLGSN